MAETEESEDQIEDELEDLPEEELSDDEEFA